MIEELEKTDYAGALGRIQFDEAHDVKVGPGLVSFAFVQWQDQGERQIVWPIELRTGEPILPACVQK